jgi:TRAP-type mannitol/chloroaromatic compound transport system permease small subunit
VKLVDRISLACHWVAMAMTLALIAVMIYEVAARYAFNAPTIWAADLSYMLNGAMFMLAAGWTLKVRGHVMIDFLVERLPPPWPSRVLGALLLFLACPVTAMIGWVASRRAWTSFATGETELVSIWQPVIWPFHAAIAAGMVVLALQCLAEGLRGLTERADG